MSSEKERIFYNIPNFNIAKQKLSSTQKLAKERTT